MRPLCAAALSLVFLGAAACRPSTPEPAVDAEVVRTDVESPRVEPRWIVSPGLSPKELDRYEPLFRTAPVLALGTLQSCTHDNRGSITELLALTSTETFSPRSFQVAAGFLDGRFVCSRIQQEKPVLLIAAEPTGTRTIIFPEEVGISGPRELSADAKLIAIAAFDSVESARAYVAYVSSKP